MKRGLSLALFIVGIAVTLCGAAVTVLGSIGMGSKRS